MTISSRTPEGNPHRCPVCGKAAMLDRSRPIGDTVCPSCGSLIQLPPPESREVADMGRSLQEPARQKAAIQEPMPITRLIPGDGGEPLSLAKPLVLVGRRASCDICLTATNISSHHCKFEWGGGVWTVHDLQSTNGTKVNGSRISTRVVNNGDKVTIAKSTFVIEVSSRR